mmetsp:Transcript_125003/g.353822  ORF Transcript_125003/g.353822 Transcript_125003/m.353822 type:complete len:284 (+) Transcript_125003:184-1035(+)
MCTGRGRSRRRWRRWRRWRPRAARAPRADQREGLGRSRLLLRVERRAALPGERRRGCPSAACGPPGRHPRMGRVPGARLERGAARGPGGGFRRRGRGLRGAVPPGELAGPVERLGGEARHELQGQRGHVHELPAGDPPPLQAEQPGRPEICRAPTAAFQRPEVRHQAVGPRPVLRAAGRVHVLRLLPAAVQRAVRPRQPVQPPGPHLQLVHQQVREERDQGGRGEPRGVSRGACVDHGARQVLGGGSSAQGGGRHYALPQCGAAENSAASRLVRALWLRPDDR